MVKNFMDGKQAKEIMRQASIQIEKRQQALNDKRSKLHLLQKEIKSIEAAINDLMITRESIKKYKDVL